MNKGYNHTNQLRISYKPDKISPREDVLTAPITKLITKREFRHLYLQLSDFKLMSMSIFKIFMNK